MRIVKVIAAALFLMAPVIAPAPVAAQTQSPAEVPAETVQRELRDMAAWSMTATQIVQRAFSILDTMPATPDDVSNRATRRTWIASARTWSAGARVTVATVRRDYAALPPPPPVTFSPELEGSLKEQHRRMPAVIDGIAGYLDRYEAMFASFERNDPKAMTAFAINSIDAIILPIAHMRDINDLTASTIGPAHPQSHLLSSVARSYDAMIALTNLTKAGIEQPNPPLGFTVEEIDAAVLAMRRHITGGRAAVVSARQEMALARTTSPQEATLIAQARRMIETYPASFDREEKIAAALERISRHLGAPGRRYAFEDPVVDSIYDEVVALDDARAADQQARQAAVASQ